MRLELSGDFAGFCWNAGASAVHQSRLLWLLSHGTPDLHRVSWQSEMDLPIELCRCELPLLRGVDSSVALFAVSVLPESVASGCIVRFSAVAAAAGAAGFTRCG